MGITLFTAFFALVVIGVPIALSLGLSSMIALLIFSHVPVMILVQKSFASIDTFTLMAIPFFILAGNMMSSGGVSQRLVNLASCAFGRYTGGLAHVATVACTFFGAISGSGPATTAAIGSVMVKPMVARGYDKQFVGACVAASGIIGILIPPSINMVLYGVITGASIGQMFIGGVGPGLFFSACIMLVNYIIAKKNNYPREAPPLPGQTYKAFKDAALALIMPIIILGGIYGGIFTPTEAAVVAAAYGVVVGLFIYKELNYQKLVAVMLQTAKNSAIIMILVATAHCFSYLLASEQIPQALTSLMLGFSKDPTILLIMITISLLIVGTFLDNAVAVVLMTPIFFPVISSVGIDPVLFGVLTVVTLAIGQITPPVGLCLFVACNLADVTIEELSISCLPYVGITVIANFVLLFVPQIVLFLPSLMK
jgi:C4-dicarboxylate transporter DctM subunit